MSTTIVKLYFERLYLPRRFRVASSVIETATLSKKKAAWFNPEICRKEETEPRMWTVILNPVLRYDLGDSL